MGAVYSVELSFLYKDKVGATQAVSAFITNLLDRSPKAFGDEAFTSEDSIERLMELMLAKEQGCYHHYEEKGFDCYSSGFAATYSWSGLLDDMFKEMLPYLNDGSYYYQSCDSEWDEYIVKDGMMSLKRSNWQVVRR